MATTGMTQKDMFAHIAEVMSDDLEVVEFCNRKIAQLSKPRIRKTDAKVEEFREKLLDFMKELNSPMGCGELAEIMTDQLGERISAQKVSAAFRWYTDNGVMQVAESAKKSDPKRYELV